MEVAHGKMRATRVAMVSRAANNREPESKKSLKSGRKTDRACVRVVSIVDFFRSRVRAVTLVQRCATLVHAFFS